MQQIIVRKQSEGRACTARNYATVLRRLEEFRGGRDIAFSAVDNALVCRFEQWLQTVRRLRRNTSSCYLRILRTVCRLALGAEDVARKRLFAHVYMGIDRTSKRALTRVQLQRLKSLDLSRHPRLALARDLFLLSFYLRGMPFVDMAFLRKTDLRNGTLHYCRRKTRRPVAVRWEREMQEIVDRYAPLTAGLPYLLPIIRRADGTERRQYERAAERQNRRLATVATVAGLPTHLTQYAARHSWASVAYAANIPLTVISRGMGHSSERVTQIYLKTLDTADVDRANRRIIRL